MVKNRRAAVETGAARGGGEEKNSIGFGTFAGYKMRNCHSRDDVGITGGPALLRQQGIGECE